MKKLRDSISSTANRLAWLCPLVVIVTTVTSVGAEESASDPDDAIRRRIGWGWEDRPHGQSLASEVLGQWANGDPERSNFGGYGPYGGAKAHGFFFYGFNSGRYQTVGGLAAHIGRQLLAVPDYWNHRVLLFELRADGSLASRRATRVLGQKRFDTMDIAQGASGFQFPAACAFDPAGERLFVVDEYNHRVLEFHLHDPIDSKSSRAVRVFGQSDFDAWGYDASPGGLVWDSTRDDVRGVPLTRRPNARGLFLPRGVACDGDRLFVSDGDNHRVLVFHTDELQNGPAATSVLGQSDFVSYLPNRGGVVGLETMLFPSGLSIDAGHRFLLVADSMNHRLLVFEISGEIWRGMPAIVALQLPTSAEGPPPSQPERRKITGLVDVTVDAANRVFVSDRPGRRVLVYSLDEILTGRAEPKAALGRFEMSTDLEQSKPGYVGPTGLAVAGDHLYVAEPRGNRVLAFRAQAPLARAIDLLGQFHGGDILRPDWNKYGPNDGPGPYGFDYADGTPSVSVSADGAWLLAADTIGGRLLFFPLHADGLPLGRGARLTLGVPTLTARGNNYGAARFNRPSHSVMTASGQLFVSDFQGSRLLHFQLSNVAATTGARALESLPAFDPPKNRPPKHREEFESSSVRSGRNALHVLGQKDFQTGLRGVATRRQMGKEISGLAMDRDRGWLVITEKLNHRVLIVDVSDGVETFMPAMFVLGQPDFDSNAPHWGSGQWHPRGLAEPHGAAYDRRSRLLFVTSGEDAQTREILGFDLAGRIANGMEPCIRIGGPHATVKTKLRYVRRTLALDEKRQRLWSGLVALDVSGDLRAKKRLPVVGWFGLGDHPEVHALQDYNTRGIPNLLGYSVGFCHRFGGAVNATAVHPETGTLYAADTPRYRILCFQPRFRFRQRPIQIVRGHRVVDFVGTGGLAPLRFSLVAGALPKGLELDELTGLIHGVAVEGRGEVELTVEAVTALEVVRGEVRLTFRPD